MLLFRIDNISGELKPDLLEGDYSWIAESQLKSKVTNYFEDKIAFDHQVEILRNYNGKIIFEETDYYGGNF